MNHIPFEKFEYADALFMEGKSIRQVMAKVGIARETAHRIQKFGRAHDVEVFGKTRVLTGKRTDGSFSYYDTSELQPQWRAAIGHEQQIEEEGR